MRSRDGTTSAELLDLSVEDWMGALTAFLIGLTKYLTRSDLQVRYFSFQLEKVQLHHGRKVTAAGSSIKEQGTADSSWGQTIKPQACPVTCFSARRPTSFVSFFEKGLRPRLLRIPQSPQTVWNKVFKHTRLWQTLRIQNAVGDTPLPLNGSAS